MFSTRLKELRHKKQLTQASLARELNVSLGAIGNWESGTRLPDAKMLQLIANYFDTTIDYILGRTSDTNVSFVFSIRLKELRKLNGYSQEKLALQLNVHQTAVSQWETGRTLPDMNIADKLAQLFNVSLDYLLDRTDEVSHNAPDTNNDEALMFALWGNDSQDITPEMLNDVRTFAQFVREKKKDRE